MERRDYLDMDWVNGFDGVVMVSDSEGIIVYLNEAAIEYLSEYLGVKVTKNLIGKSLWDCHKPESVVKIKELMKNRKTISYTFDRRGVKEFVHMAPWYDEYKEFAGYLELTWKVGDIPHFKKD